MTFINIALLFAIDDLNIHLKDWLGNGKLDHIVEQLL
jgi:hypothetical protein